MAPKLVLDKTIGKKPMEYRQDKTTIEKVTWLQEVMAQMAIQSLDKPFENDDSYNKSTLLDIQADLSIPGPEQIFMEQHMRDTVEKLLDGLSGREEMCIRMYFGFDNPHLSGNCTLEDIAKIYGVTRERIRQIIGKGLVKLHRRVKAKGLKMSDFVEGVV